MGAVRCRAQRTPHQTDQRSKSRPEFSEVIVCRRGAGTPVRRLLAFDPVSSRSLVTSLGGGKILRTRSTSTKADRSTPHIKAGSRTLLGLPLNTIKHIFLRYSAFLWGLLKPLGAWGVFVIAALDGAALGLPMDPIVATYVYQDRSRFPAVCADGLHRIGAGKHRDLRHWISRR